MYVEIISKLNLLSYYCSITNEILPVPRLRLGAISLSGLKRWEYDSGTIPVKKVVENIQIW